MFDSRSTARRRNECFVTILPIDPTHAWVFWEVLPEDLGAARILVRDSDGRVLRECASVEATGDTFVVLPHAGAVIGASVEAHGRVLAVAAQLPLPGDRPGHVPPAGSLSTSVPAPNAPRVFTAQAPPGSMHLAAAQGTR